MAPAPPWNDNNLEMANNLRLPAPGQGECVDYDSGTVIYYAGHLPYGAYYLASGEVRLSGRRRARTAIAGEILGLKACLANEPHTETALCTQPTRVYFVSLRELVDQRRARAHAPSSARAR